MAIAKYESFTYNDEIGDSNMLEIPVKLIVKAPNQQVEDQTIHCNLSWTIKKLKGYLSEVYPSKPNTEDQRLIYYGQLLNDSVTLKDVFTKYEAGEETHTVHLVCMPSKESLKMQARKMAEESSKKVKEESTSGASTSQRIPSPNESESPTEEGLESSTSGVRNRFQPAGYQHWIQPNSFNPQPSFNNNNNNNYMQQWAWMQQVYANYYMNQYMEMMARQNGVGFREGYEDPRRTEPARNPEPQVRDDDDDNRQNQDLLDIFYTLCRLIVLLSVVYFYSSPTRFIIVSSLGVMFYLYHAGFFRLNQLQPVANNNDVVNNNVPADANNVVPQGERDDAGPGRPDVEQRLEAQEHPSFMAVTWTFLTSFFSSMIPETPNPL